MTLRPQRLLSLRSNYPNEQDTVTITRRVVTTVQVPYIEAEISSANTVLTRLLSLRDSPASSELITTKLIRNISYE